MEKDTIIITARVNKKIYGAMETITFNLDLKKLIYAKLDKMGYFKQIIQKIDVCFEYEGNQILDRERAERRHFEYLKNKYEGED